MQIKYKKIKKHNKGITLVALVVTIVVLLILAGVSIVTLFGESGIITAAQKAADQTKNSVKNDLEDLDNLLDDIEYTLQNLPEVKQGDMVPDSIKCAKYRDNTGTAIIPGGYGVVSNYTRDGVLEENKVETGLVISDKENDDLNNTAKGNQFVWVPVLDINTIYDEKNNAGKLYEYKDNNYIPKEYKKDNKYEPGIITGLSDGDISEKNYKDILGFNSSDEFAEKLQEEFDNMIKSVRQYKGFYVGRYETGNLAETTTIPVVQKGNEKLGGINWYWIYKNSKLIAKNNNVVSSMIWGCQWCKILDWIVDTNRDEKGNKDYQLIGSNIDWGNYSKTKFNYMDSTGTIREKTTAMLVPTGSSERNQKNRIYDLAGNAAEWTLEACTNMYRSTYGGSFSFTDSFSLTWAYPGPRRKWN